MVTEVIFTCMNLYELRHSNMDQSMFSRFIRLGVPVVQLDKQGRCRSSMADLFRWRYKNLGDLPRVLSASEFQQKNKGFGFNFQMIDVVDYAGEGESEPSPHYLQVFHRSFF